MTEVDKFKQRAMGKMEDSTVQMVEELVQILSEQRHGTTVIITDDIGDDGDAERLCKVDRGILVSKNDAQNFRMKDGNFDREKFLSVTAIDGALYGYRRRMHCIWSDSGWHSL